MRFLWNATRGHRLTPWRSEFLRWRVETYSGKPAESLRARDVFGFMWEQKWELLSFSVLGRRPGAGGAAETLMGKPDPTHATKMRRMHREPGEKAVS